MPRTIRTRAGPTILDERYTAPDAENPTTAETAMKAAVPPEARSDGPTDCHPGSAAAAASVTKPACRILVPRMLERARPKSSMSWRNVTVCGRAWGCAAPKNAPAAATAMATSATLEESRRASRRGRAEWPTTTSTAPSDAPPMTSSGVCRPRYKRLAPMMTGYARASSVQPSRIRGSAPESHPLCSANRRRPKELVTALAVWVDTKPKSLAPVESPAAKSRQTSSGGGRGSR
mmetsp:Transcript_20162/g.77374  ORF Transcript_20162/g.77374 Transcript_20162/m.77374 type:complete len:233 (+) Transcript_20162:634-1332(+)